MTRQATIVDALVIRFSRVDCQAHLLWLEHLHNPARQHLTPVCEEGKLNPGEHVRRQVGGTDLVGPDRYDMCPRCAGWARNHRRCTITVHGRPL